MPVNLFDAASRMHSDPRTRSAPPSRPSGLVVLRMGRASLGGPSGNLLTCAPQRGLLRLKLIDGLMHLQWLEKLSTGDYREISDSDLIVFPEDAKFERIRQAPSGRVYALRFVSTGRRVFFWSQERISAAEKEAEKVARINHLLTDPVAAQQASDEELASAHQASNTGLPADVASMVDMMNQSLLNGSGSELDMRSMSSTSPSPAAGEGSSQPGPASGDSSSSSSSSAAAASAATAGGNGQAIPLSLQTVLRPQATVPVVEDDSLVAQLTQLTDHLPPNSSVAEILRAPSFMQACAQFTAALEEGELPSVLVQMGLPADAGTKHLLAGLSATEALLRVLAEEVKKAKEGDDSAAPMDES
mmetsp:Transcript_3149/g.10328  ORF Transcript_3149/g.10328 Transcript_3149/m.10328 type:complete len:359 (-) Transcript_3149:734-1810(-)